MHVLLDACVHCARSLHGAGEIGDLEPHEQAVAERSICGRKRPVVILDVDVMELEDDLALAHDLLVLLAAVPARAANNSV